MTKGLSLRRASVTSYFFLAAMAVAAFAFQPPPANAASFKFHKIVDTHTLVPGTSNYFDFNGSDVPAIDGTAVVFDTSSQTFWTRTIGKPGLKAILTSKRKIPGSTDTFQQFYGNTIRLFNEKVVFVGMNVSGSNVGVGIYKMPRTGGKVTKLVDQNDFVPGSATKFGSFPIDFKVRNGTVVFQNGGHVYAVPVAGGPVTAVAGDQDSGFTPPGAYCCLFAQPDIKGQTVVLNAGNGRAHSSIQTVDKSGDPATFRVIADGNTHTPGTTKFSDYAFDDYTISAPLINKAVIFHAWSNQISPFQWDVYEGLYARGGGFGFHKLVDDHTPVPGGAGNFSRQGGYPHVAANGIVVFYGEDSTGKPGLYGVHESGGTITKIIARGDPIGGTGYVADGFDFASQAMSGNLLAFRVSYGSFQGTGMYYTDLSNLPP